jgi:general secretion pathway protein G
VDIPISVGQRVRASAGFSLLELVVVIAIIAVLMAIAVSKYLALAVEAERVMMESVLSTLRVAVNMKMAEDIVEGRINDVRLLENSNPMDRLQQTPNNYAGELDGTETAGVPSGTWYFDRAEHTLVYRVHNVNYFQTVLEGLPRARFRVRVLFQDRDGDRVFDGTKDKLEGVVVTPLEPYRWLSYE